jgi:hypothetical protein
LGGTPLTWGQAGLLRRWRQPQIGGPSSGRMVEAKVQHRRGTGQRADADAIDAGRRHPGDVRQRHVASGFTIADAMGDLRRHGVVAEHHRFANLAVFQCIVLASGRRNSGANRARFLSSVQVGGIAVESTQMTKTANVPIHRVAGPVPRALLSSSRNNAAALARDKTCGITAG